MRLKELRIPEDSTLNIFACIDDPKRQRKNVEKGEEAPSDFFDLNLAAECFN